MSSRHLVIKVKSTDTEPRVYRLYIDNDLITERTYIWDTNMHIAENVFVDLEPGQHSVQVETVNTAGLLNDVKYFYIISATSDGEPLTLANGLFNLTN